MQIHGSELLDEAAKAHPDLRKALGTWRRLVSAARWTKFQDIRETYRSADVLARNRVIFDIRGNRYRLIAQVAYQVGMVRVLWFGTHDEYDALDVDTLG